MSSSNDPVFHSTTSSVYLMIAREAAENMDKELSKIMRPKPTGEAGFVITFDPERKSFKEALIAIVFSGIYLDAVLHIQIAKKLGLHQCKTLDKASYEVKLRKLGCTDESIINDAQRYRLSRREVVHEKSYLNKYSMNIAQDEARLSIDLVERVRVHLCIE